MTKKSLFGKKKEQAELELLSYRDEFIRKQMLNNKITFSQAKELFNKHLIENNYIF